MWLIIQLWLAEEQAQEPGVQVEEYASPAVQESAPVAETPAEPAAQAVAETLRNRRRRQ
mgnify:CR=1 FL=1